METVRKSYDFSVRNIDKDARTARFIASTANVDRYGESIDQTSWKLDAYRRNPVILFNHNSGALFSGPDAKLPIGKATDVGVVGGQLEVEIGFVSRAANPLAEKCWQQVVEGSLRAVSVGFVPHTVRTEKRNGVDVTVLADCELLEISLCVIPANGDCVRKMFEGGGGGTSGAPAVLDIDGRGLEELVTLADDDEERTAELSVASSEVDSDAMARVRARFPSSHNGPFLREQARKLVEQDEHERLAHAREQHLTNEVERRRQLGVTGFTSGGEGLAALIDQHGTDGLELDAQMD